MNFFTVVGYSVLMVVLGYMIGRSDGKQEGYIEGSADMYKAGKR
jgi:hypothetical protein